MQLSIITVTYQCAETIQQTLESIYAQSFDNFEHIIVDGGSNDATLAIIERFPFKHQNVISEKDKGIYDAMNKGLALAKGKYLLFINSGDTLVNNRILTEIFSNNIDADFIYGDTLMINSAGDKLGLRRLRPPSQLKAEDFLMGMLVCHQSMIVKKAISSPFNLKYRISADFNWSIECLKKANKIHNSNLIIAQYLIGGASRQNTLTSLKERFLIMNTHFGLLRTIWSHICILLRFVLHISSRSWKRLN